MRDRNVSDELTLKEGCQEREFKKEETPKDHVTDLYESFL